MVFVAVCSSSLVLLHFFVFSDFFKCSLGVIHLPPASGAVTIAIGGFFVFSGTEMGNPAPVMTLCIPLRWG